MFPVISATRIEDVLVSAKSWEEAVDILVTNHSQSGSAAIQSLVHRNFDIVNTKFSKLIDKISGKILFVFIKFPW